MLLDTAFTLFEFESGGTNDECIERYKEFFVPFFESMLGCMKFTFSQLEIDIDIEKCEFALSIKF